MSPEALAVEIGKMIVECQDRVTGIGAQQYYTPGEPQKFETMDFDALAQYYREELLDIVNYAVMTTIRINRLQAAFVPWVTEPKGLDAYQAEIGAWGDETFPQSSPDSVLAHFGEEVREFVEVAPMMPDCPQFDEAEEAADVFLLLLHFAHKKGFSLYQVAERKMAINRQRIWKTEAEPAGHFKHEVLA